MKANLENFFEIFYKNSICSHKQSSARFSEYRLHKIFYTINNVGKIGRAMTIYLLKAWNE